jgi:hypothetical protein
LKFKANDHAAIKLQPPPERFQVGVYLKHLNPFNSFAAYLIRLESCGRQREEV